MQKYSKLWSTITRDRWVLRTVRDGISLDLIDTPQCNEPFDSAHSLTGRPAQLQACQETVQSYLAKDIIEPVFDSSPGLYAAFFGVPKKDSPELTGCWDGRVLNEYIRYEHFKMEGVQTLKDLIQPGDFMTKVDISISSSVNSNSSSTSIPIHMAGNGVSVPQLVLRSLIGSSNIHQGDEASYRVDQKHGHQVCHHKRSQQFE